MLADLLADAVPPTDPAAELLSELLRALRAGGGRPPVMRGAAAAHLGRLKERVARVIEERAAAAPAREVWLVAEWFAAAAERTLHDDKRRLVAMLDALPDHLMLQDRDARLIFLNRATAELASAVTGRPPEELIGISVMDGPQPESFKRFGVGLVARACQGETFTEEFLRPGADGARWQETHAAPVYGPDGEVEAVAIANRDIHARKLAEALVRLLAKLGALVGTDSGAVLAGVAGAAIPELGDLAILELLEDGGGRFEVAHHQPGRAADLAARLRAGTGAAELLAELGAVTTLAVPIVVLGAPIALATFAFTAESGRRHGADERAIAEEVAGRAAQIVENARLQEQLAESLAFRERVMGILGHDLRNPLAVALSLSAVLARRADLPDRAKEGLGHIRRAAERMERMIHTILDFTQLRFRGTPPLALEVFELDSLARRIVDELQVARPERVLTVAAAGDLRGRWDYTRLGQVISNLASNALHHGARESPVAVEVAADDDGGGVRLAVTNRGPTIPAAGLARLFEPFWQASTENKSRGLGLGLFIAQQIVQAHGGAIEVRSQDEQTTFTVRLPRNDPAADPRAG